MAAFLLKERLHRVIPGSTHVVRRLADYNTYRGQGPGSTASPTLAAQILLVAVINRRATFTPPRWWRRQPAAARAATGRSIAQAHLRSSVINVNINTNNSTPSRLCSPGVCPKEQQVSLGIDIDRAVLAKYKGSLERRRSA